MPETVANSTAFVYHVVSDSPESKSLQAIVWQMKRIHRTFRNPKNAVSWPAASRQGLALGEGNAVSQSGLSLKSVERDWYACLAESTLRLCAELVKCAIRKR